MTAFLALVALLAGTEGRRVPDSRPWLSAAVLLGGAALWSYIGLRIAGDHHAVWAIIPVAVGVLHLFDSLKAAMRAVRRRDELVDEAMGRHPAGRHIDSDGDAHQWTEVDNGMGGFLCICGSPVPEWCPQPPPSPQRSPRRGWWRR